MNAWTQVAIESLRRGRPDPSEDSFQVLGETAGMGSSRIVALAHPGDGWLRLQIVFSAVQVTPTPQDPRGWRPTYSATSEDKKSPAGTIEYALMDFIGLWLIMGKSRQAMVGTIRLFSQYSPEVSVPVREGGFLIALEVNPLPFQLVVLGQNNEELELVNPYD
jgi:hypothetical protein